MARAKRGVWICEYADCGHTWLIVPGKGPPDQCAKCRRRKWHKGNRTVSGNITTALRAAGVPVPYRPNNRKTPEMLAAEHAPDPADLDARGRFRGAGECPHGHANWMMCAMAKGGC